MRRASFLLLALLALACERGAPGEEPARDAAPAVPGVETAVVGTARVRDLVDAFGTVVPEGEPADVRDARAALAEAEARLALAAQQVRRLASLAGVAPEKELEAARAEAAAAAAAAARARAALAVLGGNPGRAALAADERWVSGRVLQIDVPRIEAGAEGRFTPDAYPGVHLAGRVDDAPAYVDPATLTAPFALRVRDPDRRLRPGMTGKLALESGAARDALVVPAAAVVYDDAQPLVFVAAEGGYQRRPVVLGAAREGLIEIADGLAPGASVVVTGAASLLSAARLPAGEH